MSRAAANVSGEPRRLRTRFRAELALASTAELALASTAELALASTAELALEG